VWLRRNEDYINKKLVSVQEAADTLETTTEQIYKWLGNSDIPFYQVSEGKRKVIRFEIDELLQWHSTCVVNNDSTQAVDKEDK
jgi:excisionase family DNA binding protein